MNREEDKEQIVFRRRVVQKVGVLKYPEGLFYKSPQEVSKASEEASVLPIINEHSGNVVGFGLKPQFGQHYRKGKTVRDLHYIKDLMSPEEIKFLNNREKVELSMESAGDWVMETGTFNDKRYDGVHKNMEHKNIAWTSKGRANEEYGVGIRVMDSLIRDSVEPETAKVEKSELSDCVKSKLAKIKKDNPDISQKEALGKAYGMCKKKVSDSIMSNEPITPQEGSPDSTNQDNTIEIAKFGDLVTNLTEQITAISEKVKTLENPPEDSEEEQESDQEEGQEEDNENQTSPPEDDKIGEQLKVFAQQNIDVLKTINDIATVVKGLAESVEALDQRTTPRNTEINLGELVRKK